MRFTIGCKPREEYGFNYVPAVLRFQKDDDENNDFHILRFLCVRSVSDVYDDLKKKSDYIGPAPHQLIPSDVITEPGRRLPQYVSAIIIMMNHDDDDEEEGDHDAACENFFLSLFTN